MAEVEVVNVSKTFRERKGFSETVEVKALKNVSFEVNKGEIFGLLGPNGAGKTTLVNILSTLLLPDSGTIKILGHDIVKESNTVRKLISLSSAYSGFPNDLTVKDILKIFAQMYDGNSNPDKIISLLDLGKYANMDFRGLSSGNRQRVTLAKSLLINPKILLLDELTVALDPNISIKMRKILQQWQRKNKSTIILTTHNMFEADQLCDRVAIIHLGKIIAIDSPYKLKKLSKNEDAITIELATDNFSKKSLLRVKGVKRVGVQGNKINLHVDDAEKRLHEIITILSTRNKIKTIKVHEPTLEDVFLKLTGASLE